MCSTEYEMCKNLHLKLKAWFEIWIHSVRAQLFFCISCSITKIRIAQSLHHPPCPALLATVIHSRITEYPLPLVSWGSFWMRSNRTSRVWTPSWTCETLCRMVKGSPMSSLNSGYKHRTNWFNRIQTRVGIICHLLWMCILKQNLFVFYQFKARFCNTSNLQGIPLLGLSFLPFLKGSNGREGWTLKLRQESQQSHSDLGFHEWFE